MYSAPMADWQGSQLFVGDFVTLAIPRAQSLGAVCAKIRQFFTKVLYNIRIHHASETIKACTYLLFTGIL